MHTIKFCGMSFAGFRVYFSEALVIIKRLVSVIGCFLLVARRKIN